MNFGNMMEFEWNERVASIGWNGMTGPGFFVTGGTGLLGRELIDELLARGKEVVVPWLSKNCFSAGSTHGCTSRVGWGWWIIIPAMPIWLTQCSPAHISYTYNIQYTCQHMWYTCDIHVICDIPVIYMWYYAVWHPQSPKSQWIRSTGVPRPWCESLRPVCHPMWSNLVLKNVENRVP